MGQVVSALQQPDSFACFGNYGGKHVPQTKADLGPWNPKKKELNGILRSYVWSERPLLFPKRLTEYYQGPNGEGPEIYLKREDINPGNLHKINNVVAQALLANRLGKKRIIAEMGDGDGEHGVATTTVCAQYGMQCVIYIAAQDMERQAIDLRRMKSNGAEVLC
ncbi:tryptophan synthase beta chain 2, chloroplastic [Lactuca sativa]|nr:tryptophan synthase beta chain 2, chloroplastic [Lactuca sativa]